MRWPAYVDWPSIAVSSARSHGVRPHVSAVFDVHDIADITPEMITDIRLQARRNNLSATSLEFLLCDCTFSRIVMNGRSEVLDVGRATDIATPAQWKALVARDRHCQHPGCQRPPRDCQAHHIRHWTHGGPTDLENLQLLCWHHHRQHHIEHNKTRTRDRQDHRRDTCTRGLETRPNPRRARNNSKFAVPECNRGQRPGSGNM